MKQFTIDWRHSSVPFEYTVTSTKRLSNGDFSIQLDEGSFGQLQWSEVDFPIGSITATKRGGKIYIVCYATAAYVAVHGEYGAVKALPVFGLEGLRWTKK